MIKKLTHTNYSFIIGFIAFINCSIYLNAQTTGELVPFTQIYPGEGDSSIIRGNMKVIGNSILGIKDSVDSVTYDVNDEYNGSDANNRILRGYIDIDSDPSFSTIFHTDLLDSQREFSDEVNIYGSPINAPSISTTGTFSSSAAELIIDNESNTTDQICSKVVKAFLYWGAIYPAESQDSSTNIPPTDQISIERPDCTDCEHYTDIKILAPGSTEYINIKQSNSGTDHNSLKSTVVFDGEPGRAYSFSPTETATDSPYVCVANITSLFTHLQDTDELIQGNWTVANIRATTGYKLTGSGGGWSLVIIYEDPLANIQKNISLFEGFANIAANEGTTTEFNITGFETIPAGPVNVDVATIGLEGDAGFNGDEFQINDQNEDGSKSDTWVSLSYPGSEAYNFYDSSIYSKGDITRYPNSSNTIGYDSDHFSIDNSNNEYIGNNDTSADFRLFTTTDAFLNFFNGFAIDVISTDSEMLTCTDEIEESPVYIPDPILKALLVNNSEINTNGDTEIQFSEAEAFSGYLDAGYTFDYSDPSAILYENVISDLTGIEAFTNIIGLSISDNQYLGAFDFSNNLELTELVLAGNYFSDINISQNIKLTHLDVSSFRINVDVTYLNDLEDLNIRHTNFSTIDLSQNLKLKELTFFGSEISSIDLSKNTELERLSSGGAPLSELDITNNSKITYLEIQSSAYSNIDLSNNTNLESIACYGSQITNFDFSYNLNLQSFACGNNVFETLDFSKNSNLERFVSQGNESLNYVNLANGNNENLYISATDSPNLITVCVDDVDYAITNFTNIDDSSVFSNCIDEVTENTCDNIQPWTANDIYSKVGTQVVYNNKIYENKWYTQNENPEEYSEFSWSLWTLVGECETAAKSVINNDFGITVYPNTFTNTINVSTDDTNQIIGSLQLIDLSGNIIISQQGNNTLNNLEIITGGLYLLQVLNLNGEIIAIQKIIKN